VSEYIGSVRPALEGTLAMALAVGGVGYAIPDNKSVISRLILKVATGVLVYTGILSLRHRQKLVAFVELVRNSHLRQG